MNARTLLTSSIGASAFGVFAYYLMVFAAWVPEIVLGWLAGSTVPKVVVAVPFAVSVVCVVLWLGIAFFLGALAVHGRIGLPVRVFLSVAAVYLYAAGWISASMSFDYFAWHPLDLRFGLGHANPFAGGLELPDAVYLALFGISALALAIGFVVTGSEAAELDTQS